MTVPLPEIPVFSFPKIIVASSLSYALYPYPPGNRLKDDFNLCGLYPFMLQYKSPACRRRSVDRKPNFISRNTAELKSFGPTRRKTPFFINKIRPPIDPVSFSPVAQFYESPIRTRQGPFSCQQNILSKFPGCVFHPDCCQCIFISGNSHVQPGNSKSVQEYACQPFSQQIAVILVFPQQHCHQKLQYCLPRQNRSACNCCRIRNTGNLRFWHP